ncbi:hypothetical protein TNCV_2523851 [Trichonephila clavipes]|nr:hypothetical protein TNCV_2523851 [Trichonephila clavipes]
MGSALETGGWQFMIQHGHMRRLNQSESLRMSPFASQRPFGCFSTHHVTLGLNSLTCFCLHDGPFKLSNHVFFLMPMVFTKQNKHSFGGGLLVRGYPLGLGPAEQHIPMHPGLSGSVTGTTVVEGARGRHPIGSR